MQYTYLGTITQIYVAKRKFYYHDIKHTVAVCNRKNVEGLLHCYVHNVINLQMNKPFKGTSLCHHKYD